MIRIAALSFFACMLTLPALAAEDSETLAIVREEWVDVVDALIEGNERLAGVTDDPLVAPMTLCEAPGCAKLGQQTLTGEEAARLRALFGEGSADAEQERRAIGRAIALYETMIGPRNGTERDLPRNTHEGDDEAGQLDCIAESANTRTYLGRLRQAGLLRYHQVGGFVHRYTFILQHIAVDVTDTTTDEHFIVDSWIGPNGEEPEIAPYDEWRSEWAV